MLFCDRLDDCKTKADGVAGRFGGKERFKQASLNCWADAAAGVCDGDANISSRMRISMAAFISFIHANNRGAESDYATSGHGLVGIENHISKHLLNPCRIGVNEREVRPVVFLENNLASQEVAKESDLVLDKIIQVHLS